MRLLWGALAVVVAAVLLAGCGEEDDATADKRLECPRQISAEMRGKRPQKPRDAWISLNRPMGPESVGILMAQERDYFADVGLNVTVTSAAGADGPLRYVWEEIIDFGLASQPEVVAAKEEGAPVLAVSSLIPQPTAAMIWLEDSEIDGVADLEGKTIAISGVPIQKDLLRYVLEGVGLTLDDVKVQRVGYELVPALAGGRADAVFAGSGNLEGAALEARGLKPVITPVRSLGIPDYEELVVVARADRAAKDPLLIRDFISAVARGNAAAVEDPEGAARLIERSIEADPAAGRRATEAGVEATLPLLAETGCMDPDQASDLVDWMHEEGLIRRAPPTPALLTNLYVSPQSPKAAAP
jgi:putative hydroxymethylpyrimidine transport system substrate-binding protein